MIIDKLFSNEGSLGKRLLIGTFWSFLGTVLVQGANLLASILVVHIIGKTTYGELGIINNTTVTFGTLAGMGLGLLVTKYVAELKNSDKQRAGKIIAFANVVAVISSSIICIVLFILSPVITAKILNAPHLSEEFSLSILILFISTLSGVQIGVLSGFESFKMIAKLNLAKALINLPLIIVMTYWGGLLGYIYASILTSAIGWTLNQYALWLNYKKYNISCEYSQIKSEIDLLWNFSLPALLGNVVGAPILWLSNVILVNQNKGFEELALLNVANQWKNVIMLIPNVMSSAAIPILASINEKTDTEHFSRTLEFAQTISIAIVLPISVIIYFLGDWIMLLYGKDFSDGLFVLLFMILGVSVSAVGSIIGAAIAAKAMLWLGLLQNLTWNIVVLGFVYFLSPVMGAKSFSLGFAISHIILLSWGVYIFKNNISPKMFRQTYMSIIALTSIAFFSCEVSGFLRHILFLPVQAGVGYFIYSLLSMEHKAYLIDLIKRRKLLAEEK